MHVIYIYIYIYIYICLCSDGDLCVCVCVCGAGNWTLCVVCICLHILNYITYTCIYALIELRMCNHLLENPGFPKILKVTHVENASKSEKVSLYVYVCIGWGCTFFRCTFFPMYIFSDVHLFSNCFSSYKSWHLCYFIFVLYIIPKSITWHH